MPTRARSSFRSLLHLPMCLVLAIVACGSTPGPTGPDDPQTPTAGDTPPASAGHSLVYADHLGMVLLVNAGLGGMTSPAASTPTRIWGWNGTSWRLLDSSGPPVRNLGGVTYDTRRQTLVMFGGGYDLNRIYGDTWEWSGSWRRVAGSGPEPRDHTQLAFDVERGRAVLFGGSGSNPNAAFPDTWEYDGTRWERIATGTLPGRVHHAMHYDAALRRVVLFGGFAPGASATGETWTWNGATWTAEIAGPPRSHARLAYHGRLNALFLLGGMPATVGLGVLMRQGAQWTASSSANEPAPRHLIGAAYDPPRDRLVVFGGGANAGAELYNDTWEFDGTTWTRK